MVRILLIGGVIIAVLGVLFYFRFIASSAKLETPKQQTQVSSPASDSTTEPQEVPLSLPQARISADEKIQALQLQVNTLTEQVKELKKNSPEARISALESSLTALKAQNSSSTTTTSSTTSTKFPLYIPLGSGGSVTSTDWVTLDNYNITLDSASYPGYTSVQLEVNMRMNDPKGITAYARLINITDNSAITQSQASTTSTSFGVVRSSNFSLTSGSKTYKIQVKTQNQAEMLVQDARLKINF